MQLPPNPRAPPAFIPISTREQTALLADAQALQAASGAGEIEPLLRGKKYGLLSASFEDADAALFRLAAEELGAHVAHVHTSLSEQSTPQEIQRTARMLGRLYDAIECQGMASTLVRQVGAEAGVPVFDGLASREHPTAPLAEWLDGPASPMDRRRFVLQAVLLNVTA